jgi:NADPH-dependent curcumin reductase CurA
MDAYSHVAAYWIAQARLRLRETATDRLKNAPEALIGILAGSSLGKPVVRLSSAASEIASCFHKADRLRSVT